MKFSTRTTYGLRAMIMLADKYNKGSISLAQIAKEENLSRGYLERIFAALKKKKLVLALKGKSGGYILAYDPQEINIYEIVSALEGDLSPFHCIGQNGKILCSNKCNCGATGVLLKVQKVVHDTLSKMKLSDLLKK